jgi:RHS repeat-associated protein
VTELYKYSYDKAQRLLSTTHALNGGSEVTLVSNTYDELGRLKTKNLGRVDTTTYAYNVRSWVKNITGNRFTESLYYNQNTANLSNFTACYNGNIAGMQWNIPSEKLGYNRAYTFAYDGLNRLTDGKYAGGTTGAYNETFGYDKMGNITTLNRNENGSGLNQLTLNYTGNQLLTASDALAVTKLYGSEAFDNKASRTTEYAYDTNGSMIYDANSGISTIQYNVLNLPNVIQFAEGHKNLYTYDATGKKLRLRNITSVRILNVPQDSIVYYTKDGEAYKTTLTDYAGNYIYQNDTLKMVLLPEGYWQNGTYYYYLKDHLGDNRVTINSSGAVIEKSHYYPSGMRFFDASTSNSATLPYRYNGKELEAMNGLNQYDYGARRREAGLPMWTAIDPLAEKYYSTSPYTYCNDNPIRLIDPNGLAWKPTKNENTGEQTGYEWIPDDQSYNKDGSLKDGLYDQAIFFSNNTNDNNDIGSSTAYVYLADGSSTTFDASTRPSDENNYPTTPAGMYEAKVGEHHGSSSSYPALKVRNIDASSQTIELGTSNPAHPERTYAEGIDIHKAGKNNYTGTYIGKDGKVHGVSEGCLLIDKNSWNSFINTFNNSEQKSNVISVTVSRTLAQPTNTNVLQKTFAPQSIPSNFIQKIDAVKVSIPSIR